MPRSEASRQKDRDRAAAWKKAHPERARKIQSKANAKYAAAHPRTQLRLTPEQTELWYQAGLSIVGKRSPLLYIDTHGRLRHEEELSAEELLRRWKAQQRKEQQRGKKRTGQKAPQGARPRKAGDAPSQAPGPRPPRRGRQAGTLALPHTQTMPPEEARQLLENFDNQAEDDRRTAYIAIMKGPRARELAALHDRATTLIELAADSPTPADKRHKLTQAQALEQERHNTVERIITEIEARLAAELEEGNPKPWANWPK